MKDKTAIEKMVESMEGKLKGGDLSFERAAELNLALIEARRLAAEEAKEKPVAPASLVEYPCPTCGAERFKTERRLNGDSWCRYGHKHPTKDFVRPSTQADIVGELKKYLEFHYGEGHTNGMMIMADLLEIIRKHEGDK